MKLRNAPPILAVDGGGTSCRFACNHKGDIAGVQTGAANVSTDFDGALFEIKAGLRKLCDMIGERPETFFRRPAFIGLAGMISVDLTQQVHRALPLKNIKVADDRPAALCGAFGDGDGFLAHCGTGSFFGMQRQGQQNFIGGWGPVLGDEASSLWVGRSALQASLETIDGLIAPSDLTNHLLREFDGTSGIVRFAGEASPSQMAKLAQIVSRADVAGDSVAKVIMQKGAVHIAKILKHLDWQQDLPICLTGGIGPHFERHLPQSIQEYVVKPKATTVAGALELAYDFAMTGRAAQGG